MNIQMEKNEMEKDIIKRVKLILKLKKKMEKEKNIIMMVNYIWKANIQMEKEMVYEKNMIVKVI